MKPASPAMSCACCYDSVAVCPAGTYGAECALSCGHCHSNQNCHHVTGACPSQCAAGYTNPKNSCHEGKLGCLAAVVFNNITHLDVKYKPPTPTPLPLPLPLFPCSSVTSFSCWTHSSTHLIVPPSGWSLVFISLASHPLCFSPCRY